MKIPNHHTIALGTFIGTISVGFALASFMTPNIADATDEVTCDVWTPTIGSPSGANKKLWEPDAGGKPTCYGKGTQCKDWITTDPDTGRQVVNCEIQSYRAMVQ